MCPTPALVVALGSGSPNITGPLTPTGKGDRLPSLELNNTLVAGQLPLAITIIASHHGVGEVACLNWASKASTIRVAGTDPPKSNLLGTPLYHASLGRRVNGLLLI